MERECIEEECSYEECYEVTDQKNTAGHSERNSRRKNATNVQNDLSLTDANFEYHREIQNLEEP